MSKKPKRPRTMKREADRSVEKLQRDARKVYELEPGGAPERPITLASPSQVEVDAEGRMCPACGGRVRLLEPHAVLEHQGERLRVARTQCILCREAWSRYYRVGAVLN
jgi:hypothetical protein